MLQNYHSTLAADELLLKANTLALWSYENVATGSSINDTVPSIRVAEISGQECLEVWQLSEDVVADGVEENCTWRRSKNFQFITITAPLSEQDDFEQVTYSVYQQMLKFVEQSPQTEFLRFWNYIPHINHGNGDRENYKRFCNGRLLAFTEHKLLDQQFPAASAVGHYSDGITVCALTTCVAPTHHANPRQVDAFNYPRQYGPSSPSFARATTAKVGDKRLCFISGTASILGHDSVHHGDLRLQLYTTNDNILYLLQNTGFTRSSIGTLRVYLRDRADYRECKRIVEELYPDTLAIYTHADICRSDLLVEIECFCISE
ncbi:MAG: hypothetical protein JKX81_08365 [Arenicella sp.]|nr:hypothetical protein [Arenicella sp.]